VSVSFRCVFVCVYVCVSCRERQESPFSDRLEGYLIAVYTFDLLLPPPLPPHRQQSTSAMQSKVAIRQVEMALILCVKRERGRKFSSLSDRNAAKAHANTHIAPQTATIPLRTAMMAAPIAETIEDRQLATAPMMCVRWRYRRVSAS
jgi:hypothetical protein